MGKESYFFPIGSITLLVYRQIKCNIQIMLEMSQVHNKFVKSVDLLYLCMHVVILVIKIHLA